MRSDVGAAEHDGAAEHLGDHTPHHTADHVVDPDAVARARRAALPEEELVAATALLRLVGDPTRARLLYALHAVGELCVCDLAAVTGALESTVSQALRLLRASGVVATRRVGRQVHYRLADLHVGQLLEMVHQHVDHGTAATAVDGRAAG